MLWERRHGIAVLVNLSGIALAAAACRRRLPARPWPGVAGARRDPGMPSFTAANRCAPGRPQLLIVAARRTHRSYAWTPACPAT